MYRIIFLGDGKWAVNSLLLFLSDKNIDVLQVVLRNTPSNDQLQLCAQSNRLTVKQYENINNQVVIEEFLKLSPDLIISMSYDQIFKKDFLNIFKSKVINCHAGALPFYRGRNVLNWVLINDEPYFGITVHFVDEGIDTGDIIEQKLLDIDDKDNYYTLLQRSYVECPMILYQSSKEVLLGTNKRIKQDAYDTTGSYCRRRTNGDEHIQWNLSSRKLFCFVRALCIPGPMAQGKINNSIIKINEIKYYKCNIKNHVVGEIIRVKNGNVWVKTIDGCIVITDYYTNYKIKAGDVFE